MTNRSGQKIRLTLNEFEASRITSLFLFGDDRPPVDYYDRVKTPAFDPITVQLDLAAFMSAGAGRMVRPSDIPLVQAFFADQGGKQVLPGNSKWSAIDLALAGLLPGVTPADRQETINTFSRDDGGFDYQSNAYILGEVTYGLSAETRFHVVEDANGNRQYFMTDVSLFPVTDDRPDGGEDFDFVGGGFLSALYNSFGERRVDPYGIGDTVEIEFLLPNGAEADYENTTGLSSAVPIYTAADLARDESYVNSVEISLIDGAVGLYETIFTQLERQFVADEVLAYEDEYGEIMYGTEQAEELSLARVRFGPFNDGNGYLGERGTILGGAGDDSLFGSRRDGDLPSGIEAHDWLYGHEGNDEIYGRGGNDRLYGGSGRDTLDGGGGADELWADVSREDERGAEERTLFDGRSILSTIHGDGDVLRGGAGDDTLHAVWADDVDGGRGDEDEGDRLVWGEDLARLYIDGDFVNGENFSLNVAYDGANPHGGALSRVNGIEQLEVRGTDGDDEVDAAREGLTLDIRYDAAGGTDVIETADGDDLIFALDGLHAIDTGGGDDTLFLSASRLADERHVEAVRAYNEEPEPGGIDLATGDQTSEYVNYYLDVGEGHLILSLEELRGDDGLIDLKMTVGVVAEPVDIPLTGGRNSNGFRVDYYENGWDGGRVRGSLSPVDFEYAPQDISADVTFLLPDVDADAPFSISDFSERHYVTRSDRDFIEPEDNRHLIREGTASISTYHEFAYKTLSDGTVLAVLDAFVGRIDDQVSYYIPDGDGYDVRGVFQYRDDFGYSLSREGGVDVALFASVEDATIWFDIAAEPRRDQFGFGSDYAFDSRPGQFANTPEFGAPGPPLRDLPETLLDFWNVPLDALFVPMDWLRTRLREEGGDAHEPTGVTEGDPAPLTFEEADDVLAILETARGEASAGGSSARGGEGDDALAASAGSAFGYGGDDRIASSGGGFLIDGGAGFDTVSYAAAPEGVTVDLAAPEAASAQGDDTIFDVERILGSAQADTMRAGDADVMFDGRGGADTLRGGEGDDVLRGGLGADLLDGGAGTDTAHYGAAIEGIVLNLASGVHDGEAEGDAFINVERFVGSRYADAMTGSSVRDRLFGGQGDDTLLGGAGNDQLEGGTGADVIDGGAGTDTAQWIRADEGVVLDLESGVHGGAAHGDVLSGIERYVGSAHDDTMIGGGAHDTLIGGRGADVLSGGGGRDRLQGDEGADLFVFSSGGGRDVIADFEGGSDRIDLSGTDAVDFAGLSDVAEQRGAHLHLNFGGGDRLIVLGVDLATLSEDDFVLG